MAIMFGYFLHFFHIGASQKKLPLSQKCICGLDRLSRGKLWGAAIATNASKACRLTYTAGSSVATDTAFSRGQFCASLTATKQEVAFSIFASLCFLSCALYCCRYLGHMTF